jgi:hypothetical protein
MKDNRNGPEQIFTTSTGSEHAPQSVSAVAVMNNFILKVL